MNATNCPSCGHILNATKPVGLEEIPISPGDGSVCLHCAAMLVYLSPGQGYRLANSLDMVDWPSDELSEWFEARRRVRQLQAQRHLL